MAGRTAAYLDYLPAQGRQLELGIEGAYSINSALRYLQEPGNFPYSFGRQIAELLLSFLQDRYKLLPVAVVMRENLP